MSELSDKAIEVLRERGWTRRTLRNHADQVCAVGAVIEAATGEQVVWINWASPEGLKADVLLDEMRRIVNDSEHESFPFSVPYWNDHIAQGVEDVILLIKKAGAAQDE